MATRRAGKAAVVAHEAPRAYPDGSVDAAAFLESLSGAPLTFGRYLRSLRLCDELTQTQMSATLGISKANLSDIENNRRPVSPRRAAAWAEKLGYHPAAFVQLVIQDQLDRAGLSLRVSVEAA